MVTAHRPHSYQWRPGPLYEPDASVEALDLPIWREGLSVFEWAALHLSPVYYGCGVPRGQGEPVIVVPGFLGSDAYLTEMHLWLGRIGYRPYYSRIGRNADCPDHLARVLYQTVLRARNETGMAPMIVGHSLGGMLARSVALDHPNDVSRVITLAAPFKDSVRAHPAVIGVADSLRRSSGIDSKVGPTCFTGHCTCDFTRNMLLDQPFPVDRYAIYSKNDAVVDWTSCLEDEADRNVEVFSTHIGMAFDARTYTAIASLLAREPA